MYIGRGVRFTIGRTAGFESLPTAQLLYGNILEWLHSHIALQSFIEFYPLVTIAHNDGHSVHAVRGVLRTSEGHFSGMPYAVKLLIAVEHTSMSETRAR
jgi:hypothetical protein